jgi:hypothetical protein
VDPSASERFRIHFLTHEVVGETESGSVEPVYAEVVAVAEGADGRYFELSAHVLHDLTPTSPEATDDVDPDVVRNVENWVRVEVQRHRSDEQRALRLDQADLRTTYLREAISAQRLLLEKRWTEFDEKVHGGAEEFRLVRDEAGRRIDELDRRERAKLEGFDRLGIVRPGSLRYLGTADVRPPAPEADEAVRPMRADPAVEAAAMSIAMAYEREAGWEPEDVSSARDGSGFDIRSTRVIRETGALEVRRIEVKGRSGHGQDVGLYRTEWYAAQRFRDGFWLYVVYGANTGSEKLVRIQDPFGALTGVEEIAQVTGYRVPGSSIEAATRSRTGEDRTR